VVKVMELENKLNEIILASLRSPGK
jgi:hypothetical protein